LSSGPGPGLLDDSWGRYFPALPRGREGRPREAFALAAPVEPLEHQSLRKVCEVPDAIRVANDSVVVPVPLQLASEGGNDFGEREAPRFLQPVRERRQSGSELLRVGLATHPPVLVIASAPSPVEVKAETASSAIAPLLDAKPDPQIVT